MTILKLILTVSSLFNVALSVPTTPVIKRAALDDFVARQSTVSLNRLLANIGSSGAKAFGASSGATIASPSRSNPDYFYTWTRDSALVFKAVTDQFLNTGDTNLQVNINNYIAAQAGLQSVTSASGGLSDGTGLGEPRLYPNGSGVYTPWARPQRDGPALRATALIAYGRWLLDNNYKSAATDIVWPILKNDLAFVGQYCE
jgi:glucoamylase